MEKTVKRSQHPSRCSEAKLSLTPAIFENEEKNTFLKDDYFLNHSKKCEFR
jgi:hypothetical protein